MNKYAQTVINFAEKEVGVREHGNNRGPEIDGYSREIGLDPGHAYPWCAIFVSAMLRRAALECGVLSPLHPTAGVFTLDERASPSMRSLTPIAGSVFIKVGHEHTGLVVSIDPLGVLHTIEGNTNTNGSSNGDGVYARTRRKDEILCYLDLNIVQDK